jgi:hypothetical protein
MFSPLLHLSSPLFQVGNRHLVDPVPAYALLLTRLAKRSTVVYHYCSRRVQYCTLGWRGLVILPYKVAIHKLRPGFEYFRGRQLFQ